MSGKFTKCCNCAEKACPDRKVKKAEEEQEPKTSYEQAKDVLLRARKVKAAFESAIENRMQNPNSEVLLPEEIQGQRQQIDNLVERAEKLFRTILNSNSATEIEKAEGLTVLISDYRALSKMSIRDIDRLIDSTIPKADNIRKDGATGSTLSELMSTPAGQRKFAQMSARELDKIAEGF